MGHKPKVLLLHSEISPYRLPLFEELSKHFDLHVYFCKPKAKGRLWGASTEGYSFKNKVLKSISVGPLIINYLLPFELVFYNYQVYIIDDDPRLTLSKMSIFLMAKLLRKSIIIWSGVTEDGYYGKTKNFVSKCLFAPVRRFTYQHVDAFLAYGHKTATFLTKNRVSPHKVHIATQAVPMDDFTPYLGHIDKERLKKAMGFTDKKVILYVGYLIKRKGVAELIEAFKQLNRDDTVLIIAGAGREASHIKSLAAGQENIYFPGYIEGTEKARYYAIADIFVLPSYVDSWGLVINEAMMFGLPVITTTKVGASELIKDNGIIINPGDVVALKDAMKRMLDDDALRYKMGVRSKEIIKDYTIQQATKTFIRVVHEVLMNANH